MDSRTLYAKRCAQKILKVKKTILTGVKYITVDGFIEGLAFEGVLKEERF